MGKLRKTVGKGSIKIQISGGIFMGKPLEKAVSKFRHQVGLVLPYIYVHPKFLTIHFSLHIFEELGDVIDGCSQDTQM